MNIKILVLLFIIPVAFSCNSNNTKHKKDELKDDEVTVLPVSADGNKTGLKYLENSKDIAEILCQGWENEDDVAQLKEMEDNSDLVIPFRGFYISSDGTFTKNVRNEMEYGNWVYDDEAKTITFNYIGGGGGKDVYKIVAVAADELQLRNRQLSTVTNLKFISSGKVFNDPLQEPFHIDNNRWRIHPAAAEDDATIRNRLKANLHFFIMYYKDAIAKNLKFVPFYGLPSCLKWYSGAIYIQKEDELNPEWIKCFYNKAQALTAYKMMDKVMDKRYKWPKNETNWLKQNLAVLQQMYNNVDSL